MRSSRDTSGSICDEIIDDDAKKQLHHIHSETKLQNLDRYKSLEITTLTHRACGGIRAKRQRFMRKSRDTAGCVQFDKLGNFVFSFKNYA